MMKDYARVLDWVRRIGGLWMCWKDFVSNDDRQRRRMEEIFVNRMGGICYIMSSHLLAEPFVAQVEDEYEAIVKSEL
jgi:hypothetical protein